MPDSSPAPAPTASVRAPAPRRAGPADVLRTVAALAAIVPGLAAGAAVGLVRRDRRAAMNAAYAVWARLGPRAAGIRLEVRGAEHLSVRPAVFVLNHQSGIDALLTVALLQRDFVGVAKAEIRRNPLLGPAFAVAGTVFVDRADRARALAALAPAVETLRRGLAIAVAPEGTRSRDGRLGAFKKGPFRMALAAGVPVVPVVIHDSAAVLPARGWWMRAGTVHVTVHPPVPTQAWREESIGREIGRVRGLFLRTLAAGPDAYDRLRRREPEPEEPIP